MASKFVKFKKPKKKKVKSSKLKPTPNKPISGTLGPFTPAKTHPSQMPNVANPVRETVPETQGNPIGPIDAPPDLSKLFGQIHAVRMQAIEVDEYRTRLGWPVAIPEFDVRNKALVSAAGVVIERRPDPLEIETGASVRWVADDELYDETAQAWYPMYSEYGSYKWHTAIDFAPTYVRDYEYIVGKEFFSRPALNFEAENDEHFWSSFSGGIEGASGYTVLMVLNLNSVFSTRNDNQISWSGVWCPGSATGFGQTFDESMHAGIKLELHGTELWLGSEQRPATRAIALSNQVSASAPFYLALNVGYPTTTVHVGASATQMRKATISTGAQQNLGMNVVLGRSTGSILHTADMAIFDVGIYSDRLSDAEVIAEVAKLAQTYGGPA